MKVNKKSGLLVLLVVVLVTVYAVTRDDATEPVAFLADLHKGEMAVFKLSMRDGTAGEAVSTGEMGKIEQFIALMQTVTFTKTEEQQPRLGWSYYVDLHTEDKGYQRITFLDGQLVHFSAVDMKGNYRVEGSPYYGIDRNLSAELECFYISLEQAGAGEGGSEKIQLYHDDFLKMALNIGKHIPTEFRPVNKSKT